MSAARLFADNIYDAMRDAWATRVPATTPCPDAGALAALVDPAFQVSLQREEGRQIRCSAMLCSPTTTLLRETAAPRHGHTFTLSEPLSYSDQILRKIAGAYDASNAVLLVEFPRGGEPRIWGFGYYGSSHFREPAPAVITGYEVSWPDKPLVRIDSPGKLFLAQGDAMIGTLDCGSLPTRRRRLRPVDDPLDLEFLAPDAMRFIPVDLGELIVPSGNLTTSDPFAFPPGAWTVVTAQPPPLAKLRSAGDSHDRRNRPNAFECHATSSRGRTWSECTRGRLACQWVESDTVRLVD
jgi:hypothetical protein